MFPRQQLAGHGVVWEGVDVARHQFAEIAGQVALGAAIPLDGDAQSSGGEVVHHPACFA